jgi:bisanhydrobacterioruberin hydratase
MGIYKQFVMENRINGINYVIPGTKEVQKFIILFYIVGITGIIIPWTNPLFLRLIPLALILSFVILGIFHAGRWDSRILTVSLSIYLLGYAIEVIGVNSGLIFGEYRYGAGLGLKAFSTPLIIGINWLMLVYVTSSVTEKYNIRGFSGIIAASLIMLLYDIVLEQVAPEMDMWHWENNQVPLQNYAAWFVMAVGFHSIFKAFKIKTRNSLAGVILICQFCFFLGLYFFFNIIK